MKIPPKYRALLLALGLFVSLIWLTPEGHKLQDRMDSHSKANWQVQFELRGDLGDLAYDFVAVQDTFGFHMQRYAVLEEEMSSSWGLNYCCEDWMYADAGDAEGKLFQWWAAFNFEEQAARQRFLKQLLSSEHVRLDQQMVEEGWAAGTLSLALPVPGTNGEKIRVKNVAFNLRLTYGPPVAPSMS